MRTDVGKEMLKQEWTSIKYLTQSLRDYLEDFCETFIPHSSVNFYKSLCQKIFHPRRDICHEMSSVVNAVHFVAL